MSIIHTCYLAHTNVMDYLIKLQEYEIYMKKRPGKMDAMELPGDNCTNCVSLFIQGD